MIREIALMGALWGASVANAAETAAVTVPAAASVSTATLSLTFRVPEVLTISYTCATPDPSGDGSCDVAPNAPAGTAVLSFKINGAPSAYAGTPTFTESTGTFKMSGSSIVTAVSPLTAATYMATVSASQ